MKKKKLLIIACVTVLVIGVLAAVWSAWFSATRIAFVNYQVISLGELSKANDNPFIRISELTPEELDKAGSYDMIFINGMGLRITEEQRALLRKAADKGLPVLTTAATNPANNLCSLDSTDASALKTYLGNGGRRNYRSLLNYVRGKIDGKLISVNTPEAATERSDDLLYHADPGNPEEEALGFNSIGEYDRFLRKHGLLKEGAPRIVITGQMGDPTDLIRKLEETGNTVYPVRNMQVFIRNGQIDSVQPSALINLAHGRMGDYIVDYLKQRNIPLFAPLSVNSLVEEWENDPMGMNGGFLSQSVVTPEIDGAIRPYALFGNYKDSEGLQHQHAIPERLETFVETVNNYLSLQHKPNNQKRVAIYYYKGPGQNALAASGMEVVPSLYNLLVRLKRDGYKVDGLPASPKELGHLIQAQGSVLGSYAEGAFDAFMKNGKPELISKEQYESWVKKALRPEKYAEVVTANGEFPGEYMATRDGHLGVARLQFGNIILLPQNAAGKGDNAFKVVHGTDAAPPHTYIASYLWTQFGFKADALIHFGTHGSLEFTPKKQVALSNNDWPDRLVGALPHFYVYSIGNVGEGVIAKRRAYAGLQSYLTPPFLESNLRGTYRELSEKVKSYNNSKTDAERRRTSLAVKTATVKSGIHRELGLDSLLKTPYTEDEIIRIENFAEELATEKITGQLYTMGVAYEPERITSSVYAMSTEPIAYSLFALDKLRHRADEKVARHRSLFTQRYLNPARDLVTRLLTNPGAGTDELICRTAGITPQQLTQAREVEAARNAPKGMMAMMMAAAGGKEGKKPHAGVSDNRKAKMKTAMKPGQTPKPGMGQQKEYTKEEVNFALAVMEVEHTIRNIGNYKNALLGSPEAELSSLTNALKGGYTQPSPGGDPIVNPNTLPTGRNLFAINAEETPTEAAWEKGIQLANNTITMYRSRHNDSIPRKVSYTLWSGEFIETGGATIAQILYMLGVEPIRDTFGRVSDLRLISSKELGRPRIDVVVQTSGQLRDIAASRLFLINRAVEMAAAAKNEPFENQVAEGVMEAERILVDKGLSPKDAREISTFRVFGGANGGYGTGIQGMVQAGDRWENEKEIADTYLNNMGAYYGSEKNWETFRQYAFEAALTRTDAVIQPRQSNTWGALSLDHVYEFMGGMNLAVRNVTGKDPDAYLSDYRNRNNARMQEVKEAIGIESRSTIFNPAYIREKMKGDASGAGTFAAIVENAYGWNVMKPQAIDPEMWNEIYQVYVKDKYNLGVQQYFEQQNPAALQEITAVMLETVRKGMWKADSRQVADIARLHTDLVNKYQPSGSVFVGDNDKLRRFIASKVDARSASQYHENMGKMRESKLSDSQKGMVMKKETTDVQPGEQPENSFLNGGVIAGIVLAVFILILIILKKKRKNQA